MFASVVRTAARGGGVGVDFENGLLHTGLPPGLADHIHLCGSVPEVYTQHYHHPLCPTRDRAAHGRAHAVMTTHPQQRVQPSLGCGGRSVAVVVRVTTVVPVSPCQIATRRFGG